MKLHLTTSENQNLITACDSTFIEVNNKRFEQNILVLPDQHILDWHIGDFSQLNEETFNKLSEHMPEVVLLGTGNSHRFSHPKLYQALTNKGTAVECMTTAAACRTYNILMSEGRNVAAALLLE